MSWIVDVIVILILVASVYGGMKEGAVKNFFQLLAFIIAIPLTGQSYRLIAGALSFLPGINWENFLGFFITLAIISVILHFIFFLPRRIIQKLWKKGLLFRLVGAVLSVFGTIIGLTVFALVLRTYPIFDWLERVVSGSGVLTSLAEAFGFVQAMLPDVFRQVITTVWTAA